jgi:hypothetical protein
MPPYYREAKFSFIVFIQVQQNSDLYKEKWHKKHKLLAWTDQLPVVIPKEFSTVSR